MVAIDGRPILWHIIQLFERYRITDFNLTLGYKGEIAPRDVWKELRLLLKSIALREYHLATYN